MLKELTDAAVNDNDSFQYEAGVAMHDISMKPALLIRDPGPEYADAQRVWQGIPGIERAPGGRLWAAWYSGGQTEGPGNYVVLVTSDDDGRTWSAPCSIIAPPDPGVRCFDPALWLDPLGRLWLCWAQSESFYDDRAGVWAMHCADADRAAPTWTTPRRLTNGIMMNKPTVLATGAWVFPTAVWAHGRQRPELAAEYHSNILVSLDAGETWTRRGGADIPGRWFDEHMVIERAEGTLWMLVRTEGGVGQALSTDDGITWQTLPGLALPGPNARFFIRRLRSGRLLLVNHEPEHGWSRVTGQVAAVDREAAAHIPRNNLMAMLSEDDGRTWIGGLMLDERNQVSYPDGVQADDGRIYLIYDRERYQAREILLAVFTEDDILAGSPTSPHARLRLLVNTATSVPSNPAG